MKTKRWVQRNPGIAVSVSAIFVSLIVGLAVSLTLMNEARSQRNQKEHALDQYRQLWDIKEARNPYGQDNPSKSGYVAGIIKRLEKDNGQ